MAKHTTVTGHVIEYAADEATDRFISRLCKKCQDPRVDSEELTALAFSSYNPILNYDVLPGMGVVTRSVVESPSFHVMTDLLYRKRLAESGVSPERLAKRYTMTVTAAAAELGIHESAVRQAIAARRLVSWLRDGRHYLDPAAVRGLEVGTRGPRRGQKRRAGA